MAQREGPLKLTIPAYHNLRVAIGYARFNNGITSAQLKSAIRVLEEYAIPYETVDVPGCYELPFVLQQLAQTKKFDALVALGCLIKGDTIHFEVISHAVGKAILDVSLACSTPIGFGVITALTREQAEARTEIGADATHAALESALKI